MRPRAVGAGAGVVAGAAMLLWLMLVYWADGRGILTPLEVIGRAVGSDGRIPVATIAGAVVHLLVSLSLGVAGERATRGADVAAVLVRTITGAVATGAATRYVLLPLSDPAAAAALDPLAFVAGSCVFGTVLGGTLVAARGRVRMAAPSRGGVVALAGPAAGLAVVAAVAPARLLRLDRPIAEAVRGEDLVFVLDQLTRAGSQRLGIAIAVVAAVVLWKRCRPLATAWPVLVASAIATDVTLKLAVDRPRPPDPEIGTALGSFPSGHVLMAVVVFGMFPPTLYVLTRNAIALWGAVVAFAATVFVVAYSRVYLGAHWPSDTVASVFLGAALLGAAARTVAGARGACGGCVLHSRARTVGDDALEASPTDATDTKTPMQRVTGGRG